jgi:hypothetical protein
MRVGSPTAFAHDRTVTVGCAKIPHASQIAHGNERSRTVAAAKRRERMARSHYSDRWHRNGYTTLQLFDAGGGGGGGLQEYHVAHPVSGGHGRGLKRRSRRLRHWMCFVRMMLVKIAG